MSPASLPVSAARADIVAALEQRAVLILCGETGSGKSTQLPQYCLQAGLGTRGLIGHTQPRRIAARSLAERIATELGSETGGIVGWQVRFRAEVSDATRIKLMTDGVLLSEMRSDPWLRRYDALIIDEAHERSLNIDFLFGCLQRIRARRPDLALAITSATLDADRIAAHFEGARMISVPGRSHPIESRFRPPPDGDLNRAVVAAVNELWSEDAGDVLVFLPGEREIRDCAAALERATLRAKSVQILPLYARLASSRQQAIFSPGRIPRIVLATNVAETSLTVPGIRHVIDTGLARISRYNPRSKIQGLDVEPISQASARQRRGRCGRTAPGVCIHLYDEDDLEARPEHTTPEIQRTNLAAVLLRMADLGLGEPETFPFVDRPAPRYLRDARRLLEQLGAFDASGALTDAGRRLARFPLDPRLGRIILAADELGVLDRAIVTCAALALPDPRLDERDDKAAWRSHDDDRSEFQSRLNLWDALRSARERGEGFSRWCKAQQLNPRTVREWQDLVRQLRRIARSNGLSGNGSNEADIDLHRALLFGLCDHIGQHQERGEYRGPRELRFRIHPGSAMSGKNPPWLLAAEIVSTRRTYARCVARVEAEWIEAAAGDQLKHRLLETGWDTRRGEAYAIEQTSLYGLILHPGRRVALVTRDPQAARGLFIREALVAGRWGRGRPPAFLRHNLDLRREIETEEARLRRRDLLVSEAQQHAWYAAALPDKVRNRKSLLRWLDRERDSALRLDRETLLAATIDNPQDDFPGELIMDGYSYPLRYVFDPGSDEDGINITVPLTRLNQIDAGRLSWLVPGQRTALCDALLRGLPRSVRKHLLPLPQRVEQCVDALADAEGEFHDALARILATLVRRAPSAEQLRAVELEPALRMRIVVTDADGKVLAAGRDLQALRARFGEQAREEIVARADDRWQASDLDGWSIPDLPDAIEVAGVAAHPRLCERDGKVHLRVFDSSELAAAEHRRGLVRLFATAQRQRLKMQKRSFPQLRETEMELGLRPAPDAEQQGRLQPLLHGAVTAVSLAEDCQLRAILDVQLADANIFSEAAFSAVIDRTATDLNARALAVWTLATQIAQAWSGLRAELARDALPEALALRLRARASWLLPPGFMQLHERIEWLPRQTEALRMRCQAARENPARDEERERLVAEYDNALRDLLGRCATHQRPAPAALSELHELIEEYHVSVFAQRLGTRAKVSPKRLDAAVAEARTAVQSDIQLHSPRA